MAFPVSPGGTSGPRRGEPDKGTNGVDELVCYT